MFDRFVTYLLLNKYILAIKFIEKIVISDKIGFDELSEIEQYILIEFFMRSLFIFIVVA